MIRKLKSGKYRIYSRTKSRSGKRRNLGTVKSRKAARRREHQIQYFKNR